MSDAYYGFTVNDIGLHIEALRQLVVQQFPKSVGDKFTYYHTTIKPVADVKGDHNPIP